MSRREARPAAAEFGKQSPEWSGYRIASALDELRAIDTRETALLRIDRVLSDLSEELSALKAREDQNYRRLRSPIFAREYRSITLPHTGLESAAPIERLGVMPDGSIAIADSAGGLSVWLANGSQSWALSDLFRGDNGAVVFDVDSQRGLVVALEPDQAGLLRRVHPGLWEYVSLHGVGSPIQAIEVLNDGRIGVLCADGLRVLRESTPRGWSATELARVSGAHSFEILPSGWIVLGEVSGPSIFHAAWVDGVAGRIALGPTMSEQQNGRVVATRVLTDGGIVVGRSSGRLSVHVRKPDSTWRELVLSHSSDAVVEIQSLPDGGFFLVRSSGTASVWMRETSSAGNEGYFRFSKWHEPLGWREWTLFTGEELQDTVHSSDISIAAGRMLADGRIVLGGRVGDGGRVVVLRGCSPSSRGAEK